MKIQKFISFYVNSFSKTKKIQFFYRRLDILYNLGGSKNYFGERPGSLEDWFSRKPAYKGLRGFLMTIFGISMTENL